MRSKSKKCNKLWVLWQKCESASVRSRSMKKKIATLSEVVCAQIAADASRFSRLGDFDEEIYAHLVALMGVYRRVTELADSSDFDDTDTNALISGICEVLSSRLREFDEADFLGNPVKAEKAGILDEALTKTSNAIAETKSDSPDELYSIYNDGLRFCLSRLDDLHSRESARFYTELIEREYEELGNIVKIQRANEPTEYNEQNITVSGILDALDEAYRMTEPILENFKTLQNAPQKESSRSFGDFEKELAAALSEESAPSPELQKFFAALDTCAANFLDETDIEYKRAAYTLQRLISAELLLAEEIRAVFAKALADLQIEGENQERDILAGIRETIEIKISGLNESTEAFSRKSGETLKEFSNAKTDAPEGEREEIIAKIRGAWMESSPQENAVSDFFAAHEDLFAPSRERVEAQIENFTKILEKSSLSFKKEVLLYEVCTFEEILTHSVSRLRNSQNAAVSAAAQMLDNAFREIEIILKKNNIAVLRPAVKEMFNAKEHEVLVAEKHDDFEKGEIIKVVTAGYRLKEQVILRANIIAAR